MSDTPTTDRRDFIARVATAAAVLGTTACAAPLSAASGMGLGQKGAPFDDSWTRRVQAAKHRAVFDSPDVADGLALEQASIYMAGYRTMFDAKGDDIVPVVVMRHMGTVLAMNDALWDKYALGEMVKLNDPSTDKPARRNMFIRVSADDKKALIEPGSSLESLHARGVVLLACNRAAIGLAGRLAKKFSRDAAEVRADVLGGIVPGVLLQPSGIYATTRAQEVGCVFMRST